MRPAAAAGVPAVRRRAFPNGVSATNGARLGSILDAPSLLLSQNAPNWAGSVAGAARRIKDATQSAGVWGRWGLSAAHAPSRRTGSVASSGTRAPRAVTVCNFAVQSMQRASA